MEPILQIKDLTKRYKNFTLDHVSMEIPQGMIYGLVGENGAGKTTTISAILNMVEKNEGTITVFGRDYEQAEREIKQDIGVVIDGLGPYSGYYVKDIHPIMKKIYENWDRDLFFGYLDSFKLPLDKKIKDLSKGMSVKLNFAIALSHHPRLLILDEATSGLDPVMRDEILSLLQEFVLDGTNSVLLSTHITSDLDKIADYVMLLHEGKVMFVKTKEELDVDFGILHCGKDMFNALSDEDIVYYIKEEFEYRVLIQNKRELRASIRDLAIDRASIEDIMLFYIRGKKR
ncbi:ABC transporter ATP-binding protein [Murimonas intestini]|uniref:ABC transporter ATP-binding protein n=1 Tax=Murimonas intestini TaxID=1337051 RepID=UPI0011DE1A5A|nr:ABC transporter ATP-binding protein [Murimonas intestini]